MRRLTPQATMLSVAMAIVSIGWQHPYTAAQANEDGQAFATSLDRAFNSDELEWLAEENRLLLTAKVNDTPAMFKIDSGALGTLLTLKSAKDRSLRVIDFNTTFTGAGGSGKIYGSPVKRLQLGTSIDLANQRLMVIDLPALDAVDGLLGVDILGSTKAIIDYRHKKLRVPKVDSAESLEKLATDAGITAVDLERDGKYVYAELSIGDESLRMLIDTGAQRTVIGASAVARLEIAVQDTDERVVGAGGTGPKIQKAMIEHLSLGKTSFLKFECVVMPVDYLGSYSKNPIDGILGADALARSNSLLSIAEAVLVLGPEDVNMDSMATARKP